MTGRMRALAICVFRHDGRILVAEGYDSVKRETFYRPLGGTIEFGEHSSEAVAREIGEELGAEVTDLRYLGTLENLFVFDGRRGHEIVLVYDGKFVDAYYYDQPELIGDEMGHRFKAVWKRLDDFGPGRPPVYPSGLLEMLEKTK